MSRSILTRWLSVWTEFLSGVLLPCSGILPSYHRTPGSFRVIVGRQRLTLLHPTNSRIGVLPLSTLKGTNHVDSDEYLI